MIEKCDYCGETHETGEGYKLGGIELKECPRHPRKFPAATFIDSTSIEEKHNTMAIHPEYICKCGHHKDSHGEGADYAEPGACAVLCRTPDFGHVNCGCAKFEEMEVPELITAKLNKDETHLNLQSNAGHKFMIEFYEGEKTLGKFFINDEGKFNFAGDASESAKSFIAQLKEMWIVSEEPEKPLPCDFPPIEKVSKKPPAYCASCGDLLPRTEKGLTFPCECPNKTNQSMIELITTDANEHIRRKQLKS